jgi:hypothetical protein
MSNGLRSKCDQVEVETSGKIAGLMNISIKL